MSKEYRVVQYSDEEDRNIIIHNSGSGAYVFYRIHRTYFKPAFEIGTERNISPLLNGRVRFLKQEELSVNPEDFEKTARDYAKKRELRKSLEAQAKNMREEKRISPRDLTSLVKSFRPK